MMFVRIVLILLAWGWLGWPPTWAAESPPDDFCLGCHEEDIAAAPDAALNLDATSPDAAKPAASVHKTNTCTSCHTDIAAEHPDNKVAVRPVDCSQCHGRAAESFNASVHGLALAKGQEKAARCVDCHGAHRVLPSTDPRSSIHQGNLVVTCARCHPGATENFARGKVHVDAAAASAGTGTGERINRWVRRIYVALIAGGVGLMLAHNLLLFGRKVRARCHAAAPDVPRMTRSQRLQHVALTVSFIALALTGFALKFPDSLLAKALGSSGLLQSTVHRVAGVVLLVVGACHAIYFLTTREGRQLIKDFLPVRQDLKDLLDSAKYLTGLGPAKPKTGRFGYVEKVEYWGVVWGTVIMGATGLMVWCKMEVTRFMPRWAVDVALTIHYYEAILACLTIVVWHFYHVLFDPDVHPLNWACWNGKVSRRRQAEPHPLDPAPPPGATPTADGKGPPGVISRSRQAPSPPPSF